MTLFPFFSVGFIVFIIIYWNTILFIFCEINKILILLSFLLDFSPVSLGHLFCQKIQSFPLIPKNRLFHFNKFSLSEKFEFEIKFFEYSNSRIIKIILRYDWIKWIMFPLSSRISNAFYQILSLLFPFFLFYSFLWVYLLNEFT